MVARNQIVKKKIEGWTKEFGLFPESMDKKKTIKQGSALIRLVSKKTDSMKSVVQAKEKLEILSSVRSSLQ